MIGVSIHASVMEATIRAADEACFLLVSIHASVMEATFRYWEMTMTDWFRSTPP